MKNKYILLLIFIILSCAKKSTTFPDYLCFEKIPIKKQYALLSCKVDSLHYALDYFIDELPPKEWYIKKIPLKKEKYLKLNPDKSYSISNPTKWMLGSFNGQEARFTSMNELKIYKNNNYHPVVYDPEKYIDIKNNYEKYNKIISFGIDTRLLVDIFKDHFKKNKISYNFFYLRIPTVDEMAKVFIKDLNSERVIICNGTVEGYDNERVFTFKILENDITYKWKEAVHSYTIIGYDLNKKYFIVADTFGNTEEPYIPKFRKIAFDTLFGDITMINKNELDYSFSIGK